MSAPRQFHACPGDDVVVLVLDPSTCAEIGAAVDLAAASGLMQQRPAGSLSWSDVADQILEAATTAALPAVPVKPAGLHLRLLEGGA